MRRRKPVFAGIGVALAAVLSFPVALITALPAAAVVTQNCAEGQFPNTAASQSALNVACTFLPTGSPAGLPSGVTIHDFGDAIWHWGAGHNVTGNTSVAGASTVTLAVGAVVGTNGVVGAASTCPTAPNPLKGCDINHSIEGPGIPPGDFITAYNTTTRVATIGPNPTVAGGAAAATLLIANTAARSVNDAITKTISVPMGCTGVATQVCSLTAHFTAADAGKTIGGGDLPDGATITTVNSTTRVTISSGIGVTAQTGVSLDIATGNPTTSARVVTDATWTGVATKICSLTAKFASSDIGLTVSNGGGQTGLTLPPYVITAVASPGTCGLGKTEATLNHATSAGSTAGKQTVVGLPTKTAPANGQAGGSLTSELTLSPVLSPGSPPCAAGKISAFSISLLWYNPGSYNSAAPPGVTNGGVPFNFSLTSIPGTTVGQLEFTSTTVNFSAFVVQNATGWDLVFGFLPVALGVCAGTPNALVTKVFGTTANQLLLPSRMIPATTGKTFSTGPAGTAQLRALKTTVASTMFTSTVNVVGAGNPTITQPTNHGSCKLLEPRSIDSLTTVTVPIDLSSTGIFRCGNG